MSGSLFLASTTRSGLPPFGDELRAIVALGVLWNSSRHEQVREHIKLAIGSDSVSHFQRQAYAGVFIRDRQPLQRTSMRRPIMNEIPSLNVVLPLRQATHATVAAVTGMLCFRAVDLNPFFLPIDIVLEIDMPDDDVQTYVKRRRKKFNIPIRIIEYNEKITKCPL